MRIFLVGVTCVGKSTIGPILAERRDCSFFDLDSEVERHFGTSIERIQNELMTDHSYRVECAAVLERVAINQPDCVIALPPSGLRDAYLRVLRRLPGLTVALHDTAENILDRIAFYDIDSMPIDMELTERERSWYLKEIKEDISYFKQSYRRADLQVTITGYSPEESAARIDALAENATAHHRPLVRR